MSTPVYYTAPPPTQYIDPGEINFSPLSLSPAHLNYLHPCSPPLTGHHHDTAKGAAAGAAAAAVIPGIGVVVGGIVGAAVGHHEKKKHQAEVAHGYRPAY